ncbi:TRAP transporter small permease [Marinisporobacter balticus]|uniref:C4-dicarboxylate transporter DctQ subunit n=1 Tax=Marinisporobacter balticus TaxID=2018667 RepID=A0A4R2L5U2_9FIRM|nr:TRAP transporter small permease subunit [Marinisporobacter balticus]TCO74545.1 C4-dicarboxylate transporter DctQ subunit [Marinisporobacter balticus]
MDKFDACLTKIISWSCIFLMGLLTIFVITSVFLRYVCSISFVWAEELITFLFLATTYFGLVIGVRDNEHICIAFLSEKLNGKGKTVLGILIGIVIIFVQIIIVKESIHWIDQVGNVLSPGLRIPNKYIYYMMPTSCILVVVYEIIKIKNLIVNSKEIQKIFMEIGRSN